MPFDGSGGFLRTQNWQADAAAGIKIVADRHDNEDDNFANGLSSVITKDGQTSLTAHIPFNGFRATGLANPVDPQDAATKSFAESIRNFPTAIFLTGGEAGTPPVSKAFIGFTAADIGFGARKADASAPAGSGNLYDRFVWNDKADLTGADRLMLDFGTGANLRGIGGLVPGEDTTNFWHGSDGKGPVIGMRGPTYPTNPGGVEFYVRDATNNPALALSLTAQAKVIAPFSWLEIRGASNRHLFFSDLNGNEQSLLYSRAADAAFVFRIQAAVEPAYIWQDGIHSRQSLFVHGTASNQNSHLWFRDSNENPQGVLYYSQANGWMELDAGSAPFQFHGNGNYVIQGDNAVKLNAGPWSGASDARIKTIQRDYTAGLAEILALQPKWVTFKGNDTSQPPSTQTGPTVPGEGEPKIAAVVPYPNSPHYQMAIDQTEVITLIAQDAEIPMPEMVIVQAGYIDGEPVDDARILNTGPLVYALINAIKTLDERLTAVEGT